MNLTQRAAGANMSVDVNLNGSYAGGLMATSANVPYFGWIDAVANCTVTASSPSNPRIDTVVAYVDLSAISSAVTNNVGAFKFMAVAGAAAGSPVAPSGATIQAAIGAGNPYITLGNLAIATSAASVVNANITDTRVPSALMVPRLYGGSSNTLGHLVPNQADGTVVTTTDSGTVTPGMLATGVPVQMVTTNFAAVATGTTPLPFDDTIPQITEGDQYMTQAITPKSATNVLVIEGCIWLSHTSASGNLMAAVFQDATANALAAVASYQPTATGPLMIPFSYTMTAGTTSATTFRVRAGSNVAGTTTFNGQTGARYFGAIAKSFIKVTEYKA